MQARAEMRREIKLALRNPDDIQHLRHICFMAKRSSLPPEEIAVVQRALAEADQRRRDRRKAEGMAAAETPVVASASSSPAAPATPTAPAVSAPAMPATPAAPETSAAPPDATVAAGYPAPAPPAVSTTAEQTPPPATPAADTGEAKAVAASRTPLEEAVLSKDRLATKAAMAALKESGKTAKEISALYAQAVAAYGSSGARA